MLLLLGFFVSKLGLFLPLSSFIFPFLECPVYAADEYVKYMNYAHACSDR